MNISEDISLTLFKDQLANPALQNTPMFSVYHPTGPVDSYTISTDLVCCDPESPCRAASHQLSDTLGKERAVLHKPQTNNQVKKQ